MIGQQSKINKKLLINKDDERKLLGKIPDNEMLSRQEMDGILGEFEFLKYHFKENEKPEIIYLWSHKISLMGSYPDGKERYVITIPKRQRGDFYLDGEYDIKFILKKKEKTNGST